MKYQVPLPGVGAHPFWSPKGDEIIMNSAATRSTVVRVTTTGKSVAFGPPEDFPRAGRFEPSPALGRRAADMMPDGQHVLGVMISGDQGLTGVAPQITVVLDWFDEVRQKTAR